MAKQVKAKVTFKMKDGTKKFFDNVVVEVQADGSAVISLPQGRIVPGTDSEVVIEIGDKKFTGRSTSKPGTGQTTDVTLPAGTVTPAAVS